MYTAVVLEENSREHLTSLVNHHIDVSGIGFLFKTESGMQLPHHMTLNMGDFDSELNDAAHLNQIIAMNVYSLAYDESLGACAASVVQAFTLQSGHNIKSKNRHKHITCCLKPGTKPVSSNDLFAFDNSAKKIIFPYMIQLHGFIQVCK
jgi:hypothetical protein